METIYQDVNNVVLDENSVEWKPSINIESKSLDLTIKLYSCHNINMKSLVVVTPPSIYHHVFTTNRNDNQGDWYLFLRRITVSEI